MTWAQNLKEGKLVKETGKGLPARLSETKTGVMETMQRLFQGRKNDQQCPEWLEELNKAIHKPRVAEKSCYTDMLSWEEKKNQHSTGSPPFWTLLATVTEDSQCPDWAHPDCCRLRIAGFQLAQTPASGVWRPFGMAGYQALDNPLSHICLITCNPHKTGPNTGSCFQK